MARIYNNFEGKTQTFQKVPQMAFSACFWKIRVFMVFREHSEEKFGALKKMQQQKFWIVFENMPPPAQAPLSPELYQNKIQVLNPKSSQFMNYMHKKLLMIFCFRSTGNQ